MAGFVDGIKQLFGFSVSHETLSSVDVVVPLQKGPEETLSYVGKEGVGEIVAVPNDVLESYGGPNKLTAADMNGNAIMNTQYFALRNALHVIPSERLLDAGLDPEALYDAPAEEAHNILENEDIIPILSGVLQDANFGIMTEGATLDPSDSEHRASQGGMERRAAEIDAALEAAQLALGLPGYSNDMGLLVAASPDLSAETKASVDRALNTDPQATPRLPIPVYQYH